MIGCCVWKYTDAYYSKLGKVFIGWREFLTLKTLSTLAQNLTLCACVVVDLQSDRALFESHVTASELKLDIAKSWTMTVKGKKLCLQRFNCTFAIFIRQYNTEWRRYVLKYRVVM